MIVCTLSRCYCGEWERSVVFLISFHNLNRERSSGKSVDALPRLREPRFRFRSELDRRAIHKTEVSGRWSILGVHSLLLRRATGGESEQDMHRVSVWFSKLFLVSEIDWPRLTQRYNMKNLTDFTPASITVPRSPLQGRIYVGRSIRRHNLFTISLSINISIKSFRWTSWMTSSSCLWNTENVC